MSIINQSVKHFIFTQNIQNSKGCTKMQAVNNLFKSKQKSNHQSNPLKQLFANNVSPRYKNLENNKTKQSPSTVHLGDKYFYSFQDLIGDGYTSKVYKGYELQNPSKVYAIKVIEKKKLNEDQMKLVKNQLQVHPKLDHQNIVKCYDVYDTPKILYIVLQFCPHGDLQQFIKQFSQKKNISETKAIDLMEQIIQGYKYLISQGVLHRDLKPANILKCGNKLKIADFGFSVKGKKTLIDNMSVGTPLYMPPQSIQQCVYSHKSDFFALGCIMYQILHGRTPWFKHDEKALAKLMKQAQIDVSNIKDGNIKNFILSSCQISQSYRMPIEQFMQIDLRKSTNVIDLNLSNISNPESSKNTRSFLKQKTDRRNNSQKSQQEGAGKSIHSKKSQTTMETTFVSTHIYFKNAKSQEIKRITNQFEEKFQICMLLKYLVENSEISILIDQFEKKNLKIILFRHCIYMFKRILNDFIRTKSFDLNAWQIYKKTKQWKFFEEQCKLIKQSMEKNFNLQLKGMSLKNLSQVNKKFPQLNYQSQLSKNFYQKLKQFLKEIIRKFHTEIMKKIPKTFLSSPLSKNQNSQYFQAFKSLYRYFQYSEQRANIEDLKKSTLFNLQNMNTVNVSTTTKNNSLNNSGSTNALSKNNSKLMKDIQPNSAKKVSFQTGQFKVQKQHIPQKSSNYFTSSAASQYQNHAFYDHKANLKSPLSKYTMNMTFGTNQDHQYKHYHMYSLKSAEKDRVKQDHYHKKTQEKGSKTVQSHFTDHILCKDFKQSKITKQEFIGLKKKIKWLWI